MNAVELAQTIRERACALRTVNETPMTYAEVTDGYELLMVLARIVIGMPTEKAFGRPGDWGYSHPIGRALAKKEGE